LPGREPALGTVSERAPAWAVGTLRLSAVLPFVLSIALAMTLAACSAPGAAPADAPDGLPSVAGTLALTQDGGMLWVVNPDANSVTAVNTVSLEASASISVG